MANSLLACLMSWKGPAAESGFPVTPLIELIGTRTFTVGAQQFDDFILAKPLELS